MRRAISVTLTNDNALWLKARAAASANGNVSALLDRLVTEARLEGRSGHAPVRSVAGTIDIPAADEELQQSESYIRAIFDRSLRRPLLVRERPGPSLKRRTRG